MKSFRKLLICVLVLNTSSSWAADARTSVSLDRHGRPDARAYYNGTRDGRARTRTFAGDRTSAEALAIGRDHDGSTAMSYSRMESSSQHQRWTRIDISSSQSQRVSSIHVVGSRVSISQVYGRGANQVYITTSDDSESMFDEDFFAEPLFYEGD